MILSEDESIRERLCDLEKKVMSQGEELACLRSTLADVLRRIATLEVARPANTNNSLSMYRLSSCIKFLRAGYTNLISKPIIKLDRQSNTVT